MAHSIIFSLLTLFSYGGLLTTAHPACKETKIVVLGGGLAGITAAQALFNNSVTDFVIIEYTDKIGGRCRPTKFGNKDYGDEYTVELGDNWVQGIGSEDDKPRNPISTLANKYNLVSTYSNSSSVLTFTEKGQVDYGAKEEDFEEHTPSLNKMQGDCSATISKTEVFEPGLISPATSLCPTPRRWPGNGRNWTSNTLKLLKASCKFGIEAKSLLTIVQEATAQIHTIANYNKTFYGFSEDNIFIQDPRGFNTFILGEASTFLEPQDPRLHLSSIVTNITYSDDGVTVTNEDGTCVSAEYAICTFWVGVLQSDLVAFDPPLPDWKRVAIETFQLGIYTKIFIQFPPDQIFWEPDYQFRLYASTERGYYPIFQPLDIPDFLPGSGILMATVVTDESRRIEAQDDEVTKAEILVVLRKMFGEDKVPDPIDFMYPRWGQTPWARGSFSNWPPGLTLEGHQNLRANTGRLHFAGEATSQQYFGYLQGAWTEGKGAGERVATLLKGNGEGDTRVAGEDVNADLARYKVLLGSTTLDEYSPDNGWFGTSFLEPQSDE